MWLLLMAFFHISFFRMENWGVAVLLLWWFISRKVNLKKWNEIVYEIFIVQFYLKKLRYAIYRLEYLTHGNSNLCNFHSHKIRFSLRETVTAGLHSLCSFMEMDMLFAFTKQMKKKAKQTKHTHWAFKRINGKTHCCCHKQA